MNNVDDDSLARWKTTFAKDGIRYETDGEYREAIHNLVGFFEVLIEIDKANKHTKKSDDNDDQMYLLDKDGNKIIL